tara:strand:- start:181 stop:630 length:450 start_codon:yes stop_codon:yes gene_type:complete
MWKPNDKQLNKEYTKRGLHFYKVVFCPKTEGEYKKEIYEFGDLVMDYLDKKIDLEDDAKDFYKWIMCNYVPLDYRGYAEDILDYFHWREYLLFKKFVVTPKYHKKKRYLVKFISDNKLFFTKSYTSLREIQDDTGKRSTEINIIPFQVS